MFISQSCWPSWPPFPWESGGSSPFSIIGEIQDTLHFFDPYSNCSYWIRRVWVWLKSINQTSVCVLVKPNQTKHTTALWLGLMARSNEWVTKSFLFVGSDLTKVNVWGTQKDIEIPVFWKTSSCSLVSSLMEAVMALKAAFSFFPSTMWSGSARRRMPYLSLSVDSVNCRTFSSWKEAIT